MYRVELCHDRFGKSPLLIVEAAAPDRLQVQCRALDGSSHTWALSRGDLAMLRGMLANMGQWERSCRHAGLIADDITMDRPLGMDPYFYTKPPTEPGAT